jgi:hypothetical protein
MRQNGSKRGRTWRQIGPTWSKMGPKWAQGGPRSAQNDPKEAPRGHKSEQGTTNTQKGTQNILDERTFRAEGGAKSEKHYNPRFIFVPPMGPESRTRSQNAVGARIGGRGGVGGGVGGKFRTNFAHNLDSCSTRRAPLSEGRRILRPYGRAADPGAIRGTFRSKAS